MVEIHITYETLFDMLRKERSLEELQSLDSDFWSHVIDYLQQRTAFMKETSRAEQEKIRLQLENIKRILREMYEYRERKITNLAINVVKTDSALFVDTSNMLADEKKLFDELVATFTTFRKGILEQVCLAQSPDIVLGKKKATELTQQLEEHSSSLSTREHDARPGVSQPANADAALITEGTSSASSDSQDTSSNKSLNNSGHSDLQKSSSVASSSKESSSSTFQSDASKVMVKFITDVPKFLGRDKVVFGPFKQGEIVSLPSSIVSILLKKNKVKKIMSS